MSLSSTQLELIQTIDKKMQSFLSNKANEECILLSMSEYMPSIKEELLDKVPKKEFELYCHEYKGLFHFMKMLENLARRIESSATLI